MSNKFIFLANYYAKNLVLTKMLGKVSDKRLDRTAAEWDALRKANAGHNAWLVVGNGPSLRLEDLEAFYRQGVPSIASNKINILFNKTEWRPAFYTIADPLLIHKLPADHYDNVELTLVPHTLLYMVRAKRKLAWRHLPDEVGQPKYLGNTEIPSPLSGLFNAGTITCQNIQLAMWAGAKTIYVIGCDHFYANEDHKTGTRKGAHQGTSNHFDPNYRKPGEIVNEAPVDVMNRGYAVLRKMADARGIQIVNVSRKSALEAFERGTVEDALAAVNQRSAEPVRN